MTTACLPIQCPIRSTEPTTLQEPITPEEAKKQCGIAPDLDYHDEDLRRLITTAREQVENDTGLVCYTGTFTWKQTDFPCGDVWELPDLRPVTAIGSIVYTATDGTATTWGSSNYTLHTGGVTQFIGLAYGASWPTYRGDINGITITMTAGYASVAAVPSRVKQAVLLALHTQWLMENDGDVKEQIEGYERLIAGLRRGTYP